MNIGEYIDKLIEAQGRDKKWVAEQIDIEYRTFLYRLKNNGLLAEDLLKMTSVLDLDLNKVYEDVVNYEVKTSNKIVNGIGVNTKIAEITSCNILEVEVGTTGYCGGDTGHGGRTYFSIKDLASTDINIEIIKDRYDEPEGFVVELGGDTELGTFTEALEFAVRVLKDQSK